VQIVRWVMAALGKPLGPIAPPPGEDMLPGAVWRADGPGWNIPQPGLPSAWPPGAYGPDWAGHHLPENRQNRQPGPAAGNGADPAGVTKRQRIEAYLDRLSSEQLQNLTVREITSDLNQEGLEVTERYVKQVLDQQQPTQPRRRGSGARRPRR
jgi:hypothetical protein